MNERASKAKRSLLATLALVVSFGCAPYESEEALTLGAQRAEIVGGTTTTGDPEVFMLLLFYSNGAQGKCSATLINRRTLLTAAHCVDPRVANSTTVDIWATNETYALATTQAKLWHVGTVALHPDWNPGAGTLDHDLALLLLDSAPQGVTPKPWNSASVAAFATRPLRVLGYGTTAANAPTSSGVKREVALTFRLVNQDRIFLGDGQGKGVCHGDSGGPSFHTFADGVERVVGVHSYTVSESCVDGADVRVDTYTSWINGWMTTHEVPTCSPDGACVLGCASVDQDCVCVSDSICSVECIEPENDPDCPLHCGDDGICQASGCAVFDSDCVAEGAACTSQLQCPGRRCVSDPQHDQLYCSRVCASSGECQSGMSCHDSVCRHVQLPTVAPNALCIPGQSFCANRLTCAGSEGGAARCSSLCVTNEQCPKTATCTDGPQGRFCDLPEAAAVVLNAATAEAEAASGCAVSPGLSFTSALLAAAFACRRRPRSRRSSRTKIKRALGASAPSRGAEAESTFALKL